VVVVFLCLCINKGVPLPSPVILLHFSCYGVSSAPYLAIPIIRVFDNELTLNFYLFMFFQYYDVLFI